MKYQITFGEIVRLIGANQRLATFCRQMFVNLTKDSGEIIAGVFIALSLLNEH